MTDAHSIMEEEDTTSAPVSMPQTASSWQAAPSWTSLGEDCRIIPSSLSFTNVLLAAQANMDVDESDESKFDEHHTTLQHPGTQLRGAASQLSAAQFTPSTSSSALGMIAPVPFPLESTDASLATRSEVQMSEPFFRNPVSNQGVQQPNQFAKVCLNCLPRNSSNLSSRVGQTVQS
jgi:hypothetical protein